VSFSLRSASLALTLIAAFFVVAGAKARAESEFCPAQVGAWHSFGASNEGLRAFYIGAGSTRTVSGDVIVQGENGWYTFAFANVQVLPDLAHYQNDAVRFDRNEYHSKPLYLQLPAGEKVLRWWVTDAAATGDAVFNWDAKGAVKCAPQGQVEIVDGAASGKGAALHYTSDVTRTNPLHDLEQLPAAGDAVLVATATDAPAGLTGCKDPFKAAYVTYAFRPHWPEGLKIGAEITTKIAVAVNADGSIADAWVYQPTGFPEADNEALRSARFSKYHAGTALCQPAPGTYLFSATFQPNH
jgi:hypothetical protein